MLIAILQKLSSAREAAPQMRLCSRCSGPYKISPALVRKPTTCRSWSCVAALQESYPAFGIDILCDPYRIKPTSYRGRTTRSIPHNLTVSSWGSSTLPRRVIL